MTPPMPPGADRTPDSELGPSKENSRVVHLFPRFLSVDDPESLVNEIFAVIGMSEVDPDKAIVVVAEAHGLTDQHRLNCERAIDEAIKRHRDGTGKKKYMDWFMTPTRLPMANPDLDEPQ